MLFNSPQFGVFFSVIVLLYFLCPMRWRWALLLVGSYYFYMCWNPAYILLIIFSSVVDYTAGLRMGRCENPNIRRRWLLISLFANLGLLFTFKYYNFFLDNVAAVLDYLGVGYRLPESTLLLPVGISFYTFQTLSYTIDVYRRQMEPERHFGIFALYVAFFPQLVAGPIERARHLLPQFREQFAFDVPRITSGLQLILWGLFKKAVIADNLALYVDRVYADPQPYSSPTLLLATYFFAFQIYCDFSGYSDIAIGTARVLGFDLMQNFRWPYFATSIPDFWRRWHISLSTWFRDYVYYPLGGNRTSAPFGWYRNIFLVFLLSGLWHGANWTFVVWGAIHAVCYFIVAGLGGSIDHWARRLSIPQVVMRVVSTLVTFHVVVLSWCVFRAETVSDAWLIVSRILTQPLGELYWGPSRVTTIFGLGLIGFLLLVQWQQSQGKLRLYDITERPPVYVRWPAYVGLILTIAALGRTTNDFIYFQF